MGCEFNIMESQLTAPRGACPGGKLVLSRLSPGSSHIGAPAPSLKLVLEGDERYEIDGRSIAVRPGDFVYLDAGSPCIGTNRSDMTGLCLLLPHDPDLAANENGFGDAALMGRAIVMSTGTSALGRFLYSCARRIADRPELGPALADMLVSKVSRAIGEPLGESRAAMEGLKVAKSSTRRELHRRLERARGFLHEHDGRAVSLAEMAGVAGLSQFHLARYFKAAFGKSPISYHRDLRLNRAAAMLTAGGKSVADIAEATGYSDQVALSHAFRRRYGQPPHMWANARGAS